MCEQVFIPEVDNSPECEIAVSSECVFVTRRSPKLKNLSGENLNNYFELLDKKLSQLENMILQIKRQQDILIDIINDTQTGNEALDIGTWAIGD